MKKCEHFSDEARWVKIPTAHRIANSVQLQFVFDTELIMISEIRVHSGWLLYLDYCRYDWVTVIVQ